jgi:lysophospholipase L1-like esterase
VDPLATGNNSEWYFTSVPLNNPNASIAMFGDSMFKYTDVGLPASELESWDSLLGGTNITNLGLTGARIGEMYTFGNPTFLNQLITLNPDFAFVSLGTNNRPDPDAVIRNEYITLGQQLEASGIPFAFNIIFPCAYHYTVQYNNGFNTRVPEIIEILIDVCEEYGWEYVDMRKQLVYTRPQDGLLYLRDDYSIDGVHLNNAGYVEWSKLITRFLNEKL